MSRLTPVLPAELPALVCPYCGRSDAADADWAEAAMKAWGACGLKSTLGGLTTGLVLLKPVEDSRDAVIVRCWMIPTQAGRGQGRRMMRAAAALLLNRHYDAILATGARVRVSCSALPRDFLRSSGFVKAIDDRYWRLDLGRVVRAQNPVQATLDRLIQLVRPVPPEPAAGSISTNFLGTKEQTGPLGFPGEPAEGGSIR